MCLSLLGCESAAWRADFHRADDGGVLETSDGCTVTWDHAVWSLGAAALITGNGEAAGAMTDWIGSIWTVGDGVMPGSITAPGRYRALWVLPAPPVPGLDEQVLADQVPTEAIEAMQGDDQPLWVSARVACPEMGEVALRLSLPGPPELLCRREVMEVGGSSTMALGWDVELAVLFDAVDNGSPYWLATPIAAADQDGDGWVEMDELLQRPAATSGFLPGRAGDVSSLGELIAQRSRHVLSFRGGVCGAAVP
jgi:hypothetical protein